MIKPAKKQEKYWTYISTHAGTCSHYAVCARQSMDTRMLFAPHLSQFLSFQPRRYTPASRLTCPFPVYMSGTHR